MPVTADHDVTFVNNADQPVWVNLQGGPKGVCTGDIDPITHKEKACTACSVCSDGVSLCNVSESTIDLTPLCCPYPPYINSILDTCDAGAGKCKVCAGQDSTLYPFNETGALPNSAKLFFDTCPEKVYTYAYNDTVPNRQCHSATGQNSSYTIKFYSSSVKLALTPTPTSSGNSGDSDSSGSSVASAPATNAGGTISLSFNQQPTASSPVGISQVQISTGAQTESFAVTAQTVSLGSTMQVQGQPVAGYMQISPVGVTPGTITSGTISFVVSGSWLTGNNIAPADIVLERYNNNQWNALPTTFTRQSGDSYYFSAVTPGFSYFAITVKPGSTVSANTTISSSPVSQALVTDPTGIFTAATSLPATTRPVTTTTTAPPAVPAPTAGFPTMTVVVIIAAGILVMVGAVFTRRWWIRRQNPALFKDMD